MQLGRKAEFELVPRSEQCSFALREFSLPAFASPWHFHPEIELTYIVRSRGRRFVGDHIAPFGPGDLVLLGPNLPHFWHNEAPARGAEAPAHSVVIQFREDCFGLEFFARPELAGASRLLKAASRGLQFTGRARDAAARLILDLRQHHGLDLLIGLLSIFRELARTDDRRELSSAGFVPCLDESAGERINRAYQHVFARFGQPLSHEEIARDSGMSRSAFCHYFKRVTGRTLTNFITEVRIGHARKLLIETSQGIAQIAYACGFESLSNFNRCFRELTCASPKDFRRQYQAA